MITVNFGTCALATAITIFAPSRASPRFSYSLPTMKPVMFCKNTSGIRRWQQSSTKCAPARLLGGALLAGGGLYERRPADENRAGAAHDHRLVAHRRHVGAAGGARAHHDRDLGDPLGRQVRLVVENAPEVLAVGEDLGLQG